mmetsp:Transcript_19416/g.40802  ORF Transcript_19416/g.40802 Transcript_19416/m.40802 type:complete len:344 (+) Transcript_19416:710-1741(+)
MRLRLRSVCARARVGVGILILICIRLFAAGGFGKVEFQDPHNGWNRHRFPGPGGFLVPVLHPEGLFGAVVLGGVRPVQVHVGVTDGLERVRVSHRGSGGGGHGGRLRVRVRVRLRCPAGRPGVANGRGGRPGVEGRCFCSGAGTPRRGREPVLVVVGNRGFRGGGTRAGRFGETHERILVQDVLRFPQERRAQDHGHQNAHQQDARRDLSDALVPLPAAFPAAFRFRPRLRESLEPDGLGGGVGPTKGGEDVLVVVREGDLVLEGVARRDLGLADGHGHGHGRWHEWKQRGGIGLARTPPGGPPARSTPTATPTATATPIVLRWRQFSGNGKFAGGRRDLGSV